MDVALDWQQARSKQKQTKPKTNIKNPTKPTEPTPKTDTKDILTQKNKQKKPAKSKNPHYSKELASAGWILCNGVPVYC